MTTRRATRGGSDKRRFRTPPGPLPGSETWNAMDARCSRTPHRITVLLLAISAITLPLLLLHLGCADRHGSSVAPTVTEVRVGYQPFTSDLAIFIAIENGYFKENGIAPHLTMFRSTIDFLNALAANRIDVAGIIGSPTLFARECEAAGEIRLFLPAVETQYNYVASFLVPKNSHIQSIGQLKGKTVGTYSGTTQALNLKYILARFLDPERDVKVLQVSSELQLQALAGGQFDALLTIEPYSTLGVANGTARVLVPNPRCQYIMCPFPASAMAVSETYLRRNPVVFQRYYAALRKGIAFIKAHPSEAKAMLPKYTDLSAAVAEQSNLYEWQYDEVVDKGNFQKLADLYASKGVLSKRINVVRMFAPLDVLGVRPK